jgi:hypothetical protein
MTDFTVLEDDGDDGYQFPMAFYELDDDFDFDGPTKWVIISPNAIVTEREARAIVFSPLDYGIWTVQLHMQNEDGEWLVHASDEFDNPDPSDVDGPTLVKQESTGVN